MSGKEKIRATTNNACEEWTWSEPEVDAPKYHSVEFERLTTVPALLCEEQHECDYTGTFSMLIDLICPEKMLQ
jgi:hypothetical protein